MGIEDIEPLGYYNGAHGFLYDELDKDCYCPGGCSMEPVYAAEQMQEHAKNMVYEALYKHTAFGTGKEELVKHMTNIFFQEKELQEAQDEEV